MQFGRSTDKKSFETAPKESLSRQRRRTIFTGFVKESKKLTKISTTSINLSDFARLMHHLKINP